MISRARVLVADPAWKFGDALPGKGRGADKHYPTMPIFEIQRFPLPDFEEDAVLFLWRVSSMVEEAYDVCRAWGFAPKSELVWIKTTTEDSVDEEGETVEAKDAIGMGRIVRGAHETCIVATRGKAHNHVKDKGIRTIFRAPRAAHSAKPDEFYEIVEKLFPLEEPGSHVEIFSRRERKGWECFGNELARSAPGPVSAQAILQGAGLGAAMHLVGQVIKTAPAPDPAIVANGVKKGNPACPTCGLAQFILPDGWNCGNGHFVPLPAGTPKPSAGARTVPLPLEPKPDSIAAVDATEAERLSRAAKAAAGEMPFANLSKLAIELNVRAVRVTLVDISGMTPLQRGVAQMWVEQGGKDDDRPEFLDQFIGREIEVPTYPTGEAQATQAAPDEKCVTVPDGSCVADDCMHTQPAPQGDPPKKKRGRPSKAEIAAREAAAQAQQVSQGSQPEMSSHPPPPASVHFAPAGARTAGSSSVWDLVHEMNLGGVDPIGEEGFFSKETSP